MIYSLHNGDFIPVYIGKTARCCEQRLREHINGVNKKDRKHYGISKWISKQENVYFEVIDETNENIDFWEKHYISLYRSWGFCLQNRTFGGDGGIMDLQTRIRISEKLKGRRMPKEIVEKIRLATKGVPKKNKEKYTSSHCLKVVIVNGVTYNSIKEAAESLNVCRQTISKWSKMGQRDLSIVINSVTYSSQRNAASVLKISRNKIRKFLMTQDASDLLKNKYNNKQVTIKGINFDSVGAASVYFNVHRCTISEWIKCVGL